MFGAATLLDAPRVPITHGPFRRYVQLDEACYDVAEVERVPHVELVSRTLGRILRVESARVLRLHPGDYALARHDAFAEGVDLVIDLSPAPLANADMVWLRRGNPFFRMPVSPSSVAVVERGPTVVCYHGYVSRVSGGEVIRLVARLV